MSGYTSKLIKESTLEKKVEMLKAIANPTRLQIVNILMNGEISVTELSKQLGKKQSMTSMHLSILKSRDIVRSQRDGNSVYYSLNNNDISKIIVAIVKIIKDL
ncbi:ArsR/SmtB family transcription factor [Candidatus Latescibacterota bacterium]